MISSLHGLYDDRIYWKEAISLKDKGYHVIHVGVGNENKDFLSEHGIHLIQVKRKKYFANPYLDILYRKLTFRPGIYKTLLGICIRVRADVYHFHDLQINRIGKQISQLPHDPKVVYDVHEDYYEQIMANRPSVLFLWLTSLYAAYIRRRERNRSCLYDAVITAVPHIANNFRNHVQPDKLHVLYNYTALKPDRYPDYDEKSYDAIYIGLMNRMRGGLEIIEATAIIRNKIPDIRILLVGPVPCVNYLGKMRKRIQELYLDTHVIIKEPVPYHEIKQLLLQSRIGLGIFMPVKIFSFGIQVKTFEYMVCGLPVVCSNSGNIHSIISENKAGISVNPGRPEEIAQAIVEILTNRELYHKLSRNGIKSVTEKYHWGIEEKKLIRIYRDLLNTKKRNKDKK